MPETTPLGVEIIRRVKVDALWKCQKKCFDEPNCQASFWANDDAPEKTKDDASDFRHVCILVNGYKQQGFVVHARHWTTLSLCKRFRLRGTIEQHPLADHDLLLENRYSNYLQMDNYQKDEDSVRSANSYPWKAWSKMCENRGGQLCSTLVGPECYTESGCEPDKYGFKPDGWIPVSDTEDDWLFCGQRESTFSCDRKLFGDANGPTVLGFNYNSYSANVSQNVK